MAPTMETTDTLPIGQYKVVSLALDLTGKKVIDEICHIGAYYEPDKTFCQYVMPHRYVSRSATRTHGIRIFTNFGYRVLKDSRTMKTLRSKSEYATLIDLMEWLKEANGDKDGVVLAFHDNNRQNVAPFLVEAFERYKLADDFFTIVRGFFNVCDYAAKQAENKDAGVTLRTLCRKLLPIEAFKDKNNASALQSAKDRAKYTYQILQKLTKVEGEVVSDEFLDQVIGRNEIPKKLIKVESEGTSDSDLFLDAVTGGEEIIQKLAQVECDVVSDGSGDAVLKR